MIRVVLIGVTGRMGRALVRSAGDFPALRITGAVASPASAALGRDAGELAGTAALEVRVSADLPRALGGADVAIDFSVPAAAAANLAACRAARRALLIGTTGLAPGLAPELDAAARDIALLVAPNTSLAVALLIELVRIAAAALPAEFDVDVFEAHHRTKRDAPSGTALALAAAARAAREGRGAPAEAGAGRRGDEIGVLALRAGDLVGEHAVRFSGPGEELRLEHRATDRAVFARGALTAALWLASRPPGRYGVRDLLALKTAT
ncbi:MAG TPA: 4-hydroxy-tetrahydrodipicolinate reductase [Steroidobacteraceae bacterium]|jgi:4-hydroxy-tetrahydrodipicolinate reductase|nr:4-hydroxy-tetrahydrodipicolinate reductase [Steroidobacteraceae bacterium]